MEFLLTYRYIFIFTLIRVSTILTFSVFYSHKMFPKTIKFGLIFLITILLYPVIPNQISINLNMFQFTNILITEVLTGFIIGFTLNLISYIFLTAGNLIEIEGGFGAAQIFDPTTQSQSSLIGNLLLTFALICFIGNDYQLTIINIIVQCFKTIPIGKLILNGNIIIFIIKCISYGVAIALPVVSLLFMIDIILGITSKTMPQINLFSVGFIIKLMATIFFIYLYIIMINQYTIYISKIIFKFVENLR